MHVRSVKWFVDRIRTGVLMLVVILHVAMIRNISFSVNVPVQMPDGTQQLVRVTGLDPHRYDSLLRTLPLISPARSLVKDSRQTYYFNRLPGKTMNLIYCVYIYYVVVIVIRSIMYIRKRTREA
jgi:hypothetical protein